MSHIPLPGLLGNQPLGALAAFGLTRVCSAAELGAVTLGWTFDPEPTAVLVVEKDCNRDTLLDLLIEHMRGRHRLPVFRGAATIDSEGDAWDDLKLLPVDFARLLAATRSRSTGGDREAVDFLAAFGSEMVAARSTGNLKPTPFDMTAGQQKFLKSVRDLATSLDADTPTRGRSGATQRENIQAAFAEALFGPWTYADDYHSLGWDPSTEALYALSAIAPSDAGPKSVRAAVWLAVEALPLFPCFPIGGRLRTRGFSRRGDAFRWPLWRKPISLETLRSLLALSELYATPLSGSALRTRGIERVYTSDRPTDANGRGVFRPAVLLPMAAAKRP